MLLVNPNYYYICFAISIKTVQRLRVFKSILCKRQYTYKEVQETADVAYVTSYTAVSACMHKFERILIL